MIIVTRGTICSLSLKFSSKKKKKEVYIYIYIKKISFSSWLNKETRRKKNGSGKALLITRLNITARVIEFPPRGAAFFF